MNIPRDRCGKQQNLPLDRVTSSLGCGPPRWFGGGTHSLVNPRLPRPPRLKSNLKFKGGTSQTTRPLSSATAVLGVSSTVYELKIAHVRTACFPRIYNRGTWKLDYPMSRYVLQRNREKKTKRSKSRNKLWVIHCWATLQGMGYRWKGPKKSRGRGSPIHRSEIVQCG